MAEQKAVEQKAVMKQPINFMRLRLPAVILTLVLITVAIVEIAIKGLDFGLDFTGGTLVEVGYAEPVPLSDVRATLREAGYDNAVVVNFGAETDVLVRIQESDSPQLGEQLLRLLQADSPVPVELRRIEFVGPQVGEELREQGGLALLMALAMVLIYIAFRFQFKFAVGAVVALIHDVLITVGIFSLMDWDFDLTVLAAILAVVGYSLNDTIVVYDRIRENFRKLRKVEPAHVINQSITEMLGRTLMTSLTTLLVLFCLATLGGEMIRGFAVALIIGIVVGTYSSVYVAGSILLTLKISREDLLVPVKEGSEVEDPETARLP